MSAFVIGVGIALAIEGILYAAFPDQIRRMMRIAVEQPIANLRTFGLLALATGLAVIWIAA